MTSKRLYSLHDDEGGQQDTRVMKRTSHGSNLPNRDRRAAAINEGHQMKEWLSKEDEFVLNQARKRAAIRVRECRAKPIDFLAANLNFFDSNKDLSDETELNEVDYRPKHPSNYLKGLHLEEVKDLQTDISEFRRLEKNSSNRAYWKALEELCHFRLAGGKQTIHARDGRTILSSGVEQEIEVMLRSKTLAELEKLQEQIQKKLESSGVDVDYWEGLFDAVRLKQAYARLEQMYRLIMEAYDSQARKKKDLIQSTEKAWTHCDPDNTTPNISQTTARALKSATSGAEDFESAAVKLYKKEANHELEEGEELFNREVVLERTEPRWKHKLPNLEPVKPRFFNRVQTGFEWSAYNKLHYNEENLPPKVIWGYRFNIFYPDLLDKTRAPTYKIEQKGRTLISSGVNEDSCIIRFTAGPPYSDVCFEIVDKDWDHSSRYDRGFKSSFDKGILQLHFKFKRVNYRK